MDRWIKRDLSVSKKYKFVLQNKKIKNVISHTIPLIHQECDNLLYNYCTIFLKIPDVQKRGFCSDCEA